MNKTVKRIGWILIVLLISSCQKEEKTELKNMDEIHREEGIPVNVRTVKKQDFSTYLTFTSTLKGIKESTGASLLSATVEEILVDVGDYVKKDQPVIRFPKSNPALNYYQSKAAFEAAEQGFRRIENLYNSKGVSRQSYDDAKTQYDVQKANWKRVNDMMEIKAPLSGYITRLNVQISDNVEPGDSLFIVSNYDSLSATVWVADHEIRQISKGLRANAQWENIRLDGLVTRVDLAMDNEKKAFAVQIQFSNVEHRVPSGVTADIDIETRLIENTIVVHRNEILNNPDGWYVFLNKDGIATRRIVQPGLRQGMYYQITEGLEPEDQLITRGVSLVRDQSPIKVVEDSSSNS